MLRLATVVTVLLTLSLGGCRSILGMDELGVEPSNTLSNTEGGRDSGAPPADVSTVSGPGGEAFPLPWDAPKSDIYDVSGDVLTDRVTGLMWERAPTSASTWTLAEIGCSDSQTGGHTDWRLPTRLELTTIFDAGEYHGLDASFRSEMQEQLYTASKVSPDVLEGDAKYVSHHWNIQFDDGRMKIEPWSDPTSDPFRRRRCVRARPPLERVSYSFDREVASVVGTTWRILRRIQSPDTYEGAKQSCAVSKAGGVGGWRLASMKELLAMIDDGRGEPQVDPALFTNEIPTGMLWSSAVELAFGVDSTDTIGLRDGKTANAYSVRTSKLPFVCVHN